MKQEKKPYQRNFGLDVLRSVAIVMVLANHAYLGFFVGSGFSSWAGWNAAISACAVFSIEFLFVLSGYLIGSIMIRSFEVQGQWRASARDFWLRRWFRTVPNYFLFLLINAWLAALGLAQGEFSWEFMVFSQNLLGPQTKPHFFSESWSLALDEWFYFVMPLLVALAACVLGSGQKRAFWVAAIILIVIPTALRIFYGSKNHFFAWDEEIRRVTIVHLDATGWGVVAAILNKWHARWWNQCKGAKALAGLGLIAFAVCAMFYFILRDWNVFMGGRFNDLALIVAPSVGVLLCFPWLTQWRCEWPALRALVARVGDYSYSMYLAHMPLLFLLAHGLEVADIPMKEVVWPLFLVWLMLVIMVSAGVFHGFEKPVSDLRDRFTRRVQAGPFMAG